MHPALRQGLRDKLCLEVSKYMTWATAAFKLLKSCFKQCIMMASSSFSKLQLSSDQSLVSRWTLFFIFSSSWDFKIALTSLILLVDTEEVSCHLLFLKVQKRTSMCSVLVWTAKKLWKKTEFRHRGHESLSSRGFFLHYQQTWDKMRFSNSFLGEDSG